jgi:tetratricopeptide (TPR) repeat protein
MAGQCAKAADAFTQAYNLDGPLKEDALLSKARCDNQRGAFPEALQAYQEYLASYPGSGRANEISLRIQSIQAKTGRKEGMGK